MDGCQYVEGRDGEGIGRIENAGDKEEASARLILVSYSLHIHSVRQWELALLAVVFGVGCSGKSGQEV